MIVMMANGTLTSMTYAISYGNDGENGNYYDDGNDCICGIDSNDGNEKKSKRHQ